MKEISVILKNNLLISKNEFSILINIEMGHIWSLVHKPTIEHPFIAKQRAIEYIFDPEIFTIFKLVSENVYVFWDTELTRNLTDHDEFHINDFLFIKHYKNH